MVCKRKKIHSVRSPKFGGIGPWDQANRAHFRVYFNPSATFFTFPTYDADNKANQKVMKLTKGERAIRPPGKRGNVTLIHPMSYKPKVFIDEVWQYLVDKYQITYQNIWGKGMVIPHLAKSNYYKTLGPLKGVPILDYFLHNKNIFSNCGYMKENFKNNEAYQNV